ncbi:MAG: pyridoxal-dependent decarboxylase [Saprospiraceae bacterium]|nr:pyridoxal-dependent decarboxylase [Saprospiraceae bacterium]
MKGELKIFNSITEKLLKAEEETPVVEYVEARNLHDRVDLSLNQKGMEEESFQELLEDLVLTTPRTSSNLFFNQLFGGRKSKAVLGDLLAVMLNNSMYTYKVGGPQVGVEKSIINKLCEMVGYGKAGNGTFPSGGSMSNMMAMIMARDAHDAEIKLEGTPKKLIVYTSRESHYSTPKNAAMMGIGRNNVRYVNTNFKGELVSDHLEELVLADLEVGNTPFFVNLTAGTTVLGAYDPILPASRICKKYNLWLHVDGAYGGGVIFSEKYKHLVAGLEEADSFSVNAHKMLGTPLTCSIILTKHSQQLYDSFSNDAEYLYQTDGDDYNLGKISMQCGRRNDALKFWTLWKSVGTETLEKYVDQQFYLADVVRDYIRNNPDYTLYSYDDSISICFNYKGIDASELCTLMYQEAEVMVGFGKFREDEFIRFVTINSENKKEDILNFFAKLESFVAKSVKLSSVVVES